jgi:hypothetical protein
MPRFATNEARIFQKGPNRGCVKVPFSDRGVWAEFNKPVLNTTSNAMKLAAAFGYQLACRDLDSAILPIKEVM